MRTLNGLMGGRKPRPRRVVLDVELVIRESCGAHDAGSAAPGTGPTRGAGRAGVTRAPYRWAVTGSNAGE